VVFRFFIGKNMGWETGAAPRRKARGERRGLVRKKNVTAQLHGKACGN